MTCGEEVVSRYVTCEMENMDLGKDKKDPKAKQLSIGRKKFNMDPKKVTFNQVFMLLK